MAAYAAVISLLQTLEQPNPQLFYGNTAKMLDSLHATAEYFQKVLENASKSRFNTEKIKSLEEKIRVAASYVEDVFELKISQIIKVSRWTFGILQHQDFLKAVKKMNTTKKQVMEILSHDANQVIELCGDRTSSTSYPILSDKLGDDIVHGLDDDLEIIVKRLIRRSRDLDVVTITGMGGIGKTTLARKAYDHLTIRYHFDIFVWVTISQEFQCRNVFLEALHCISKQTDIVNAKDCDKMDDNELADLVQKNLKGPRYLIVVDDIWSRDVWDSIRGIFPNYNNGSRILMTTRENEVAKYANTCSPHEMKLLSLENGWRLLCDKVFGPKRDHPPELEGIGKEIVEKCQGLPLTISVIAGHLSKVTMTLESWKDVARTLSEIIASQSDKCLGVLGLSYHNLPSRLKPCFLSMSCFPEDFQVDTRRMIQLWIAEGFIRISINGKSLEEVAIDYLEDLISRNLIQARKRRFNGEIKACGIHDLLREFCLIESEMTKHMYVERTHPTLPTQKHNVCRFSIQALAYSVDDYCNALPHVARSIYLFSHFDQPLEFLSRFNLLRVLAIFYETVSCQSFPLVITKLFHLRYLQFPFHNDIPDSISELQNLQTLICGRDAKFSDYPLDRSYYLPRKIWMMKNLRCIRMKRLLFLPRPRTESLMTEMQNLEEFSVLCSTSCTNEVFSGIPNIKRLIIHVPYFRQSIPHRLLDMSRLTKLEAFKFYGSTFFRHPIKRIGFPTSLKRLSLTRCIDFDWVDISSTSMMLPNLEVLKLKRCRTFSREWRLSDNDKFNSLKLLLLSGANLKQWEASCNNFPNLKRLVLKGCHTLLEILWIFLLWNQLSYMIAPLMLRILQEILYNNKRIWGIISLRSTSFITITVTSKQLFDSFIYIYKVFKVREEVLIHVVNVFQLRKANDQIF